LNEKNIVEGINKEVIDESLKARELFEKTNVET